MGTSIQNVMERKEKHILGWEDQNTAADKPYKAI